MTPKSTGCTFFVNTQALPIAYSISAQRPDISAQRPDSPMPKDLLALRSNHQNVSDLMGKCRANELWAELHVLVAMVISTNA